MTAAELKKLIESFDDPTKVGVTTCAEGDGAFDGECHAITEVYCIRRGSDNKETLLLETSKDMSLIGAKL